MNKDRILDAMGYIDPAMVEAADRPLEKTRRVGWMKTAAIAACLCLVLAGTAVAWYSSQVKITWVDEESEDWLKDGNVAYTIDHDYVYFPLERFPDEMTGLAEEYAHDLVGWAFLSHDELEEFLGFEIWDNPVLDAAERGGRSSTRKMVGTPPNGKPTNILLTASYSGRGMTSVSDDEHYIIDDVWVRAGAHIYTNLMREDAEAYGDGTPSPGIVTYGDYRLEVDMEELYTAPSGLEATIMKSISVTYGPEMATYMAHFDVNGIQFTVQVQPYMHGYRAKDYVDDPELTLGVLKEVLDGFAFEPCV